ncbi:MAG: hypothetical protein Q9187_004878 [Circinaria calcarea]
MPDTVAADSPGVQGSWLRLAALMGCKPELAVLRTFRKLNALRLLEMQSELVQEEQDFEYICGLDSRDECPVTRSYQVDWDVLNGSQGKGGSVQRDAWRKLRDKLEAYNSAVLQQIQITAHEGPSGHNLGLLRGFLGSGKGNNSSLRGSGWDTWAEEENGFRNQKGEFVVLSAKYRERDYFTRWAGETALKHFHTFLGRRFKARSPTHPQRTQSADILEIDCIG